MQDEQQSQFHLLTRQLEIACQRADRHRYVTAMLQIAALWEEERFDHLRVLLEETPHQQSDFAWGYWRRQLDSEALLLLGPDERINAADFSVDGTRVILGSENGQAVVWDLRARRAVCVVPHGSPADFVAHTPEQGGRPDEGRAYAQRKLFSAIHGAGFYAGGGRVWTLTYGGDLVFWDAETGERIEGGRTVDPLIGNPEWIGEVECVMRSPDRRSCVAGSYGGTAWIVDIGEQYVRHKLEGHQGCVSAVCWSQDGALVATGGWDGTVRVWDAETGQELHRLQYEETESNQLRTPRGPRLKAVALDRRRGRVATWADRRFEIRDLATGDRRAEQRVQFYHNAGLAVDADANWLAVNVGETTRIWDLEQERWTELRVPAAGTLAFSPNGQCLIVGEWVQWLPLTSHMQLWLPQENALPHYPDHSGRYLGEMALSPDGTRLAASIPVETDPNLAYPMLRRAVARTVEPGYLYDIATGQPIGPLAGHRKQITTVAFSGNGERLISGDREGVLIVRDGATGQPQQTLNAMGAWALDLSLSTDGRWAAAASRDNPIIVWELPEGTVRHVRHIHGVLFDAVALSPDGALLAAGGRDGVVRLWNLQAGEYQSAEHPQGDTIRRLVFSPDGRLLLSAGSFHGVRLLEAATLREMGWLCGQKELLYMAAWSPDGSQVITGDGAGVVRIWDVETAGLTLTLRGHQHAAASAVCVQEGHALLTVSVDGVLRRWCAS